MGDSGKSLFTMIGVDITVTRCFQHCNTFATCLGIFYWINKVGTPKCRGLTEINGMAVSTAIKGHQSYARSFDATETPAATAPAAPTSTEAPKSGVQGFALAFDIDT